MAAAGCVAIAVGDAEAVTGTVDVLVTVASAVHARLGPASAWWLASPTAAEFRFSRRKRSVAVTGRRRRSARRDGVGRSGVTVTPLYLPLWLKLSRSAAASQCPSPSVLPIQ